MTITISYAPPFMREPRKNLQPKKAVDPDDEVIVFEDSEEEDSVSSDEESSSASSSDFSSSSDGSSTYASTGGASKFSTAKTQITASGGTVTTKGTGSGDHVSEGGMLLSRLMGKHHSPTDLLMIDRQMIRQEISTTRKIRRRFGPLRRRWWMPMGLTRRKPSQWSRNGR